MQTNIRGLVERLKLPTGKGMMPLFEAISNAMDAIDDRENSKEAGHVTIRLIPANDLMAQAGDESFIVDGFDISDNGVGLDERHLGAFREAYTMSKVNAGGKGVGRFTYLKVFDQVHVRSIFAHEGQHLERKFAFEFDDEDLTAADVTKETQDACGTLVSLSAMAANYRVAWPQDPRIVAHRIVEHFLIRFASRMCPVISVVCDGHEPIDLQRMFDESVAGHIEETKFVVQGQEFVLQVLRRNDGRARHEYHLCATGREVASAKLKELLPELPDRFVDADQQSYALIVLVTGEYLDEHANQERTHIAFQADDDLELDKVSISRQALNKGITETLRSVLASDLTVTHAEKFAQVERFVENAPEYRALTHARYRPLIEQRVAPGLSDQQLDEVLLHIRREVEDGVRKEERNLAAKMEHETFEKYQERFKQLMQDINEVGKAKLADYVAHRRTILDLIGSSLKRKREDDKYPLEKVLHNMIFPMGATSKDVFFEQQNLWLIDERLCFHTLLTSDKKLNQVPGLQATSGKEPDIFAFFYDQPVAVAEPENLGSGAVVIVEFKRPGRDDYTKDPGDQIIQRFVDIKVGNVKDIDGRLINPKGLRYQGYLIADLTPSLRRHVAMRYHETFDNEGFFLPLPQGDGYVEIVSYDKLIRNAQRRNHALFEKLGIHRH